MKRLFHGISQKPFVKRNSILCVGSSVKLAVLEGENKKVLFLYKKKYNSL